MVTIIYHGKNAVYRIGRTSPYAVYANFIYLEIMVEDGKKRIEYVDTVKDALHLIAEYEGITYDQLLIISGLKGI